MMALLSAALREGNPHPPFPKHNQKFEGPIRPIDFGRHCIYIFIASQWSWAIPHQNPKGEVFMRLGQVFQRVWRTQSIFNETPSRDYFQLGDFFHRNDEPTGDWTQVVGLAVRGSDCYTTHPR